MYAYTYTYIYILFIFQSRPFREITKTSFNHVVHSVECLDVSARKKNLAKHHPHATRFVFSEALGREWIVKNEEKKGQFRNPE